MIPITNPSAWHRLETTFRQIFCSCSPFEQMFHAPITHRLILFPTEGMHLTEAQYTALIYAAKQIGDSRFYVSEVEIPSAFYVPHDKDRTMHWLADMTCPYLRYSGTTIVLENSLYSSSGKWGPLVSAEDHAVVGGSHVFIAAFQEAYPQWGEDRSRFISYWRDYSLAKQMDTAWLSEYVRMFI